MKTILLLCLAFVLSCSANAQLLNFTLTNATGTNSITCTTPSIHLIAQSSYSSPVSYSFACATTTLTGTAVNIILPGQYTITASAQGVSNAIQLLTIFDNTVAPSPTLSSVSPSIFCNGTSLFTASVLSTANVVQSIWQPLGGTYSTWTSTLSFPLTCAGNYTYSIQDLINGCSFSSTFSITSAIGFPTFNLISPQNFTIGCTSTSLAVINIANAASNPIGAPVTFTLLGPSTNTAIPTGTLSTNSNYTLNTPGNWTVVVRDNQTQCTSKAPFSIFQNINGPSIDSIIKETNILTCTSPSIIIKAVSNTNNVSYKWLTGYTPTAQVQSNTLISVAKFSTPSNTLVNIYTLTITDNGNTCKTFTTFPIYQNIFPPNAAIASSSSTTLTCINPSVVLSNNSTTGVPPSINFPHVTPTPIFWGSSTTGSTTANAFQYIVLVGGTFSLVVKDSVNGCSSSSTISIVDQRIPLVQNPSIAFNLCADPQVTIYPQYLSPMGSYSYSWQTPAGATITGINSASLVTTMPGVYTVTVHDPLSCDKNVQISVVYCLGTSNELATLEKISLFPNPSSTELFFKNINSSQIKTTTIFDLNGRKVLEQNDTSDHINIQILPPGIYILKLMINENIYTNRFIKE